MVTNINTPVDVKTLMERVAKRNAEIYAMCYEEYKEYRKKMKLPDTLMNLKEDRERYNVK